MPVVPEPRTRVRPEILVYGMNYPPEFTGAGRYTGEIAVALADLGMRVTAVTAPPHYPGWRIHPPYRAGYRREARDGVDVIRCPLYLAREMRGVARLLAPLSWAATSLPVAIWHLLRHRPHTLLCIEPTLLPAPVVACIARLLRIRTILHVQDLEIDGAFEVGHLKGGPWLHRVAAAFERFTLRRFDRVVTISETMRHRLIEKGVASDRATVIRNWVDLSASALPDAQDYRTEIGIPNDAFVALYSGNIGAKQGLEMMLDAAERLSTTHGILFVIAGEGPERDSLFARYGALANVRFIGFQPETELGRFLAMPDVHIVPQMPTTQDFALPSKLGGILASGRPVIAATLPDQELARFLAGAARLVAPGDAGALAEAIKTLARPGADDQRPARLALAAELSKETALQRFVEEIAGHGAGTESLPHQSPESRDTGKS